MISVVIVGKSRVNSVKLFVSRLPKLMNAVDIYEIVIVVDDASVLEYRSLDQIPHVKVVQYDHRKGLGAACNAALKNIKGEYVLFACVDVVFNRNAIAQMQRMLDNNIGEVGLVGVKSNRAHFMSQYVDSIPYHNLDEMEAYAKAVSDNEDIKLTPTMFLESFCIMTRYDNMLRTGRFDEQFFSEDFLWIDYSLRMLKNGYQPMLANIFVHREPAYFSNNDWTQAFFDDQLRFRCKWEFDATYSTLVRSELLKYTNQNKDDLCVLDIGCACGGNLMTIKANNPGAKLYGIELNAGAARIASLFAEVIQADIETVKKKEWKSKFDYIIIGDCLEHLRNPWCVLRNVISWLNSDGKLLISLPNVMHISNMYTLLHGKWEYKDSGILDRTHLRFFTRKEIIRMMQGVGIRNMQMEAVRIPLSEEEKKLLPQLLSLKGEDVLDDDFLAIQWLVIVDKGM